MLWVMSVCVADNVSGQVWSLASSKQLLSHRLTTTASDDCESIIIIIVTFIISFVNTFVCGYVCNQTSRRLNKAKQINSTRLRKSFFPKKNWLPQVGFEPTTLCSLDRVLCQLSHRGSSVDMGRISYTNTKQGKANHKQVTSNSALTCKKMMFMYVCILFCRIHTHT